MSAEIDYFSQFLPEKVSYESDNIPQDIKTANQKEEKEFSFDDYLPEKSSNESKFDSLLRQSTQYASRAVERIGGLIPDAKKFIADTILDSYEKASLGIENEIKPGEKQREAPEWLRNVLETNTEALGGVLGSALGGKTSPELKEFSEEATGGYTKPKTYAEEKIGTVIGDITSSLLGGNRSIKNNLLIPIGANLVESILETAGFDKTKQTYGKMGAWVLLGGASNINANKFASELQNDARNSIIPNTPTNMNKLGSELGILDRKWISGDVRSASAQGQIKDVIRDIKQGKNTVHDIIERIDAINAEIDMKGGFDYSMKTPPKVRRAEIRNLNKVKGAIYKTIEDSLSNQTGSFEKFMDAQQAPAGLARRYGAPSPHHPLSKRWSGRPSTPHRRARGRAHHRHAPVDCSAEAPNRFGWRGRQAIHARLRRRRAGKS